MNSFTGNFDTILSPPSKPPSNFEELPAHVLNTSAVENPATWFVFEAHKFPEFTIYTLLSIETFSSCQKDLKCLAKFWPNKMNQLC